MIILCILALVVIGVIALAMGALSATAVVLILVFGDLIAFIAIVFFIVKMCSRRKRRLKRG